jgi:hypothetical protein
MAIRRSSWTKTHKPTGELGRRARHGYYVRSAEVGWPVARANGHDAAAVKRGARRTERPS